MAINKKINEYQHDYTPRIKACMRDGQSERKRVPQQQTTTRYHENEISTKQ